MSPERCQTAHGYVVSIGADLVIARWESRLYCQVYSGHSANHLASVFQSAQRVQDFQETQEVLSVLVKEFLGFLKFKKLEKIQETQKVLRVPVNELLLGFSKFKKFRKVQENQSSSEILEVFPLPFPYTRLIRFRTGCLRFPVLFLDRSEA